MNDFYSQNLPTAPKISIGQWVFSYFLSTGEHAKIIDRISNTYDRH